MSPRIFYTDTNGRRWQIDLLQKSAMLKNHISAIRIEDGEYIVTPTQSVGVE